MSTAGSTDLFFTKYYEACLSQHFPLVMLRQCKITNSNCVDKTTRIMFLFVKISNTNYTYWFQKLFKFMKSSKYICRFFPVVCDKIIL